MERIIKEKEKKNQQPQENKDENITQNDENKKVIESEKQEEGKKKNGKHKEEKNEDLKFEKKIKEKIFIYFISNLYENSSSDFKLDKSEIASDLEILSEDNFPVNNIDYKYSIYRFKILNFKPEDKVEAKIKLIYKINNKNYEAKIAIKDFNFNFNFDFDIFLYNIGFYSNSLQYYNFSDQDRFKIYTKYLREKKLMQRSEENISLILSTLKFIICQKKYMNFLFILIYSWSALPSQFLYN